MALKAVLPKTEYEGLDSTLKAFYKAEGDSFVLDLDGVDSHPSARSLKNALDTERNNRTKAARELQELKDKLGDLDPDEAKKALAKIKELEDKAAVGDVPEKFKEQFDKAVEARTKSVIADNETKLKAKDKRIQTLEEENKKLGGNLAEVTIDTEVRKAGAEAGLHDWAIEDAVLRARQLYRLKDGKPVPMEGDQIVYGKNGSDPKPIAEWLGELVQKRSGWVKGSSGGGAENNGGRSTGAGNAIVISREDARDTVKYRAAREKATKAGVELQISG
jgi:hypothetical protein